MSANAALQAARVLDLPLVRIYSANPYENGTHSLRTDVNKSSDSERNATSVSVVHKSSAVAEIGDRLATIDIRPKPKSGGEGCCAPF